MAPQAHVTMETPKPRKSPFRRAVVRGLAILLPPLLTIVIFLWVGNTVARYLLEPLEWVTRQSIFMVNSDQILTEEDAAKGKPDANDASIRQVDGIKYHHVEDGKYVPLSVYARVQEGVGDEPMPATAKRVYMRYIDLTYLNRYVVVPIFVTILVVVLFFLGRFLAAGMGKLVLAQCEKAINQLPVIRNVYSSVKQITDFLFTERQMEYNRVVAVEYPRKGIWSLGMVTGESMLDIRSAANEPVLSVLVPTSPAPFTGFTVTVKKSETVDLNLTIDQAFQFIVSCGVVVPPQQMAALLENRADDEMSHLPDNAVPAALTAEASADGDNL